jgi:hypothetical protein
MEAPMRRCYFIGLDTHGSFCAMAVVTSDGKLAQRGNCKTTIVALREMLGVGSTY